MPPELQQRVHEEVKRTKERSGWPAGKTLAALGVMGVITGRALYDGSLDLREAIRLAENRED